MAQPLQPIPFPRRKTLRERLLPRSTRVTAWAPALLVFAFSLLLAARSGTVLPTA